jgi:hypothetical protein
MERAWQRHGARIDVVPGLDDQAIDALLQGHDLELPELAREWWRWKDGVGEVGWKSQNGDLGPAWCPFSLELALEVRRQRLTGDPIEFHLQWQPQWVPLGGRNGDYVLLVLDTFTSEAFVVAVEDPPEQTEIRAPLLVAVQAWVDGLENGFYRWDPVTKGWDVDLPALRQHPLGPTTLV